ncbi:MAG TPA: proton-conducting transporter membrane subunit [Candidatus Binatia bacterium]|nr:proton-conducting transporter membrane subunit [Candidatus Binatia bacterium]
MTILVGAFLLLAVGACATAVVRPVRAAPALAAIAGGLGCALGVVAGVAALARGAHEIWTVAWSAPIGSLAFGIDPLSAFFLVCVFAVGGLSLLYAAGYFAGEPDARSAARAAAWLQLLVAAMAGVVIARDAISFLVAWEAMFLASYFLVTFDDRDERVRSAGFVYLVASHASVVLLLVFFGTLARHADGLAFAEFAAAPLAGRPAMAAFAVALAGFGIKAGLWPLHGWLPEAHPAAPSPVSALMSGAMIKMGVYGLLRSLAFVDAAPAACGMALLAVGGVSAIAGIALALAETDVKRVLAYSSVENVGIVALGIAVGMLGRAAHAPAVAVAGFAGALLHVLNHGLFKGLLFQAAGAVAHATGTRDLNALGGLLRRMPATGALCLVGAVAISALPPLNGFASEWLIYFGALSAGRPALGGGHAAVAIAAVPVLALAGGLAVACFVRLFGVAFLGEPRSPEAARAHECRPPMIAAMALAAVACAAIGVAPGLALRIVAAPALELAGSDATGLAPAAASLAAVSRVVAWLVAAAALLFAGRALLLRRRAVARAVTWDCGYAAPTPRMQYTATSFAEPALEPFLPLLSVRVRRRPVTGIFPERAELDAAVTDPGAAAIARAARALTAPFERLRALQRGPVQLYLLYVLLTLIALLVWQVRA